MTAVTGDTRTIRRNLSSAAALAGLVGLVVLLGVAGGARADGPPVAPTALGAAASATPEVQMPAGEPLLLVPVPLAAGASGPAVARGEGKVTAARPVTFLFRAAAPGLVSIGVSSPQNAARISVYLGDATQAAPGTTVEDGAIRWSSEFAGGEAVKIVVHTSGAEIPFRLEATVGAGSM
ncbi:MAG: hypothetical protein ABI689_14775 [Thermoanaerobaculia bacterium]